MGYSENEREGSWAEALGCTGCLALAGFLGAGFLTALSDASKRAQELAAADAARPRQVIRGRIIREVQIPALPERDQREYPYWVMVTTDQGEIKVNFDTDDPFYAPGQNHNGGVYFLPGSYRNRALDLDAMLDVGDTISFKTKEDSGAERQIYELIRVDKAGIDRTVQSIDSSVSAVESSSTKR